VQVRFYVAPALLVLLALKHHGSLTIFPEVQVF
jgi:hypothetical protein